MPKLSKMSKLPKINLCCPIKRIEFYLTAITQRSVYEPAFCVVLLLPRRGIFGANGLVVS